MRVDGVVFESPAGLEDSTSYGYLASSPDEELTVELELPAGRATPAEQVVDDVRDGLAGYFGAAFQLLAEGDTTLAGAPAKFFDYAITGDESVTGRIIVANIGAGGDWVKLAWSSEVAPGSLDAHLAPVLASFGPEDGARDPAPAGYVRQQAGPWSLDVPARLQGPRTFVFEDIEAELRVELSVLEAGAPEPELDAAAVSAGAEQLRADETELDDGARIDLELRYPELRSGVDANGESTHILAKRRIELTGARTGQARWVTVTATSPRRDGARLTAITDALLASIHAESEGS